MQLDVATNQLKEKSILRLFFYMLLPIFAIVAGMNLLFPTPDSEQYEGFYNLVTYENPLGAGPAESHFELGFSLTATFFKLILNANYYTWVIFIVGLALLIKFYVFNKFRNGYLTTIVYMITLYTSNECIVVRASIAQSISMLAFLYLDRSKFKAFLILIIAVLFHNSTSIFLIAVLVPRKIFIKEIKIHWFTLAFIICIILKKILIQLALGIPRFGPYFYDNPMYFNIWGLPRILIAIASVLYLRTVITKEEIVQKYFLNISTILVLISSVTFDFSLLSIRLLDLALPMILILFFDKLNKNTKFMIFGLVFLMASELIFTRIIDGPDLILNLIKH